LLSLFRKNYFFNILLLLPYTCLVRIGSLIKPEVSLKDELENPIVQLLLNWVPDALSQSLIACGLVFVQSCLIIFLFTRQRFSRENTLFAGVFYILFVSLLPENGILSGALIANTFFILAVINLMEIFKINHPTVFLFNSGFFIGLAGLVHVPYFLFVFFGFIAILSLRSFKIIELLQLISGVLTPVFLLFTITYLCDLFLNPLGAMIKYIGLTFVFPSNISWPILGLLIVFGLTILFTLLSYNTVTGKKMYQIQKKLDILYWAMAFSVVSAFLFITSIFTPVIIMAVPAAFILGILLSESRSSLLAESIHFVFIFLILYAQLQWL